MYNKWFYITEKIGNNAFSFEKRKNKKLWVPKLIKTKIFNEILLQDDEEKIAFEDFDFNWKLQANYGLKNFYEIERPHPNFILSRKGIKQKIYLFDNHNHALFFWYLAKNDWLIKEKWNILYHIDEHADYRDPNVDLEKTDLQSIFNYTNFSDINVGNYIIPVEKQGLIWKTIQIRSSQNLQDYLNWKLKVNWWDIILNLDLDFFEPELDFIDYNLKKKVILDIAKKASVITVSTSPFFINQELAIKVFKDLFWT